MNRSRSPHLLAAATLGLALVAFPALPAVAGDTAPTTTSDGGTTVLKVHAVNDEDSFQFVPVGGKPTTNFPEEEGEVNVGDAFVFDQELTQDGVRVGYDHVKCTVQGTEEDDDDLCDATAYFPGGTIRAKGLDTGDGDGEAFDIDIVSGTGAYAGATGTLTVSFPEGEDAEVNDLAFRYTLPAGGASDESDATTDGPEATTANGTTTIKVFEDDTGEGQYIPKGGQPQDFPEDEDFEPSPGDAFTFNSVLLQGDHKVGTGAGKCTLINLEANTHRCVVTSTFDNGTLTIDDVTAFSEDLSPFKVAIVSGTGAYAGAKGTVTVDPEDASDGENSYLTLVFTTGGQVAQVPAGGAATGGGIPGDGPETTTEGGKTTLKLLEKETGGKYVPKGGQPQDFPEDEDFVPNVGDAFTFTSELSQGGAKVGTNSGKCTVLVLKTHTERCVVTFTFANGTFTVDDEIDFTEEAQTFDAAIVSGTGAFAGAKGTLTVAQDEETADLTAVYSTTGQVSEVPSGGAATGGGFGGSSDTALLLGIGGLAAVAGLGVLAGGRMLTTTRRRS